MGLFQRLRRHMVRGVSLHFIRRRQIWARERSQPVPVIERVSDVVGDPMEFGNRFHRGEKVHELHFFSIVPKETLQEALNALNNIERVPIVGVYGDTPNKHLQDWWKKHGARIVTCSEDDAARARKHYRIMVKKGGFPQEFENAPIKRIVFRFPEELYELPRAD